MLEKNVIQKFNHFYNIYLSMTMCHYLIVIYDSTQISIVFFISSHLVG